MSASALPDAQPDRPRRIGPLNVQAATRTEVLHHVLDAMARKRRLCVAFANTHLLYCAVREPDYAAALRSFYVINDGVGMTLRARLACGAGFKENLNGTDFTPLLLDRMPAGTRVYLVGASRPVAIAAAAVVRRRWPHVEVCGVRDGYTGRETALDEISALAPDLVLAAMGNPLQERWMARTALRAPNTVFMGVGALFDFLTEAAPRAPRLLQAMRLEWAFRLAQEPRRLWRRYTVEVLVILAALARSMVRERV